MPSFRFSGMSKKEKADLEAQKARELHLGVHDDVSIKQKLSPVILNPSCSLNDKKIEGESAQTISMSSLESHMDCHQSPVPSERKVSFFGKLPKGFLPSSRKKQKADEHALNARRQSLNKNHCDTPVKKMAHRSSSMSNSMLNGSDSDLRGSSRFSCVFSFSNKKKEQADAQAILSRQESMKIDTEATKTINFEDMKEVDSTRYSWNSLTESEISPREIDQSNIILANSPARELSSISLVGEEKLERSKRRNSSTASAKSNDKIDSRMSYNYPAKESFEKSNPDLIRRMSCNIPVPQNTVSGLHYHVKNNAISSVKDILRRKTYDINHQDEKGNTALHFASSGNHPNSLQVVKLLLSEKASTKIKNFRGYDPLSIHLITTSKDDTSVIEALINKNSDPNTILPEYGTILHLCVRRKLWKIAVFLVRNGASMNIPDHEGIMLCEKLKRSPAFAERLWNALAIVPDFIPIHLRPNCMECELVHKNLCNCQYCGRVVCSTCSSQFLKGSQLPPNYLGVPSESFKKLEGVCNTCHKYALARSQKKKQANGKKKQVTRIVL